LINKTESYLRFFPTIPFTQIEVDFSFVIVLLSDKKLTLNQYLRNLILKSQL